MRITSLVSAVLASGLSFTAFHASAALPKCSSEAVRKIVSDVVGKRNVEQAEGFHVSRWTFAKPFSESLDGPTALVSRDFSIDGELEVSLKHGAKSVLKTVTCEFRRPAKYRKWTEVPAAELVADGSYRRGISAGKSAQLRFDDEEDPSVDENRVIVVLVDAPPSAKSSFTIASAKAAPPKALPAPKVVAAAPTPASPPAKTTPSVPPSTPAAASTPPPVVAPAAPAAAVAASTNGKLVLDIAQSMHGKPYCWLFSGKAKGCKGLSIFSKPNNGYLASLEGNTSEGRATLYKPDTLSSYGTYCSSYSFQVAFKAADKLGLLSKLTKKEIEQWRVMWFGASSANVQLDGVKHSALLEQSALSIAAFKLGKRLPSFSDAMPGDFVQINRNDKGAGHSVVFVDFVKDTKNRNVGFKYIAANESNGVSYAQVCFEHDSVPNAPELKQAEDDAYHAACKGSGTADFDRLYVGRLGL